MRCVGEGWGDGGSGALDKKLVVDGWWWLVNERDGFRDGEGCALGRWVRGAGKKVGG